MKNLLIVLALSLSLPFLFTERSEGAMVLRRGFALDPGQRVVVVEDVVTTGRSTREVIAILEEAGARDADLILPSSAWIERSTQPSASSSASCTALFASSIGLSEKKRATSSRRSTGRSSSPRRWAVRSSI